MCQARSVAVHPGHHGTGASGPAARTASSSAAASRRSEASRRSRIHPADHTFVSQRRRQLLDRRELVEVLVVVDVLVLPQQRVRDVHGVAAEGEHREDVAAHRVADHAEARRAPRRPGAGCGRTSPGPSPARPRSARSGGRCPDVSTLRVWWTRSPFVISTSRWSRDEVGEHRGHVGQQAHGLGEHRQPGVDELGRPRRAGTAPLGDGDGGLHHRQRERLDAVAGDRQVGPLGRPQRGGDVDALGRERRDELDEAAPRRGRRSPRCATACRRRRGRSRRTAGRRRRHGRWIAFR